MASYRWWHGSSIHGEFLLCKNSQTNLVYFSVVAMALKRTEKGNSEFFMSDLFSHVKWVNITILSSFEHNMKSNAASTGISITEAEFILHETAWNFERVVWAGLCDDCYNLHSMGFWLSNMPKVQGSSSIKLSHLSPWFAQLDNIFTAILATCTQSRTCCPYVLSKNNPFVHLYESAVYVGTLWQAVE